MNPSTVNISSATVQYTQAQRAAVGADWPDGTLAFIGSTAGDVLSIGANPSPSNGYSVVAHGTFASPTATSKTSVTLTVPGFPSTYVYMNLGPAIRVPSGKLVSSVHLEQHPSGGGNPATAFLGLASSSDEGATWTWLGMVAAAQASAGYSSTDAVPYWQEIFDGPLIKLGGYYYLWFPQYYDHTSPYWYWGYASGQRRTVARCSVAAFESAVAAGTAPAFLAWDGSGYTIDPQGTTCAAPCEGLSIDWHIPVWSQWLGCYCAVGQDKADGIDKAYVRLQFSRDGVHWTSPITVSDASETGYVGQFGTEGSSALNTGIWYVAALPPSPDRYNPLVVQGNTFDVLYTVGPRWSNCSIHRRTITFHGGSRRTRGAGYKGGPNSAYMR